MDCSTNTILINSLFKIHEVLTNYVITTNKAIITTYKRFIKYALLESCKL